MTLQYVDAWIQGNGAVAINGLMEDAATAEISRSQLWQWIRHGSQLWDGGRMTEGLYFDIRAEEVGRLLDYVFWITSSELRLLDYVFWITRGRNPLAPWTKLWNCWITW